MYMLLFHNKATLDLSKICDYMIPKWTGNDVHFNHRDTTDSLIPLIYAHDVYADIPIDV